MDGSIESARRLVQSVPESNRDGFSKLMWLLRSAQERTVESLWHACRMLLDAFSESECRNHIRHCGYRYG